MITLSQGQAIAAHVIKELTPYCERIEVAGSIRRKRPFVGDVDLVILPHVKWMKCLMERISVVTKPSKQGEQYVVVTMANGVQLDFWFAHPAQPEEKDMLGDVVQPALPGNFGTLLLCRTGSKEHNIFLAQRALSLGLNWNPHHGVMQAGRCLASETEEDVFRMLKLDYVEPERRER